MSTKSVAPSITEFAFDCPHCGAYTTQEWSELHAKGLSGGRKAPGTTSPEMIERIRAIPDPDLDRTTKERLIAHFTQILSGRVVVLREEVGAYCHDSIGNLHLSKCFHCGQVAVWVYDRVLFPALRQGPPPNPDLPQTVADDYDEATRVLTISPRSAAALLRLAVQKLCIHLGEKGKNIDDDIASLVKKGLPAIVQESLDTVRVIGNEAVHPGTLDLKDDFDTASKLFELVNFIAEQTISTPNRVKTLYEKLPQSKREAIDKRDGRTK